MEFRFKVAAASRAPAKTRKPILQSRPAAAVICSRCGFSLDSRSFNRATRRKRFFSCRTIRASGVGIPQSLSARV